MMGASRLIVLFLVRTLRHFTFASLVAAALLAHRPANAGIAIDNSSKVMVLYGYSMDLTKLELTSIHRILGSIVLPPFASDVKDALGADVEYVSDSILNVRLASAGLPRGSPEAIKELLVSKKYTHVVISDVIMINPEKGPGIVSMQVAALGPDGTPLELDVMQGVRIDTEQSNGDLDVIRKGLVAEFKKKFRRQSTEKTVHIGCISPRSPVKSDRADQSELDQLDLEQILSPLLTFVLIDFYDSDDMKRHGYRPVVTKSSYMDPSGKVFKCTTLGASNAKTDGSIAANIFDYSIAGSIGVRNGESGQDLLEVQINVMRNTPDSCKETIPIKEPFPRTIYHERINFSVTFSEKLPTHYGPAWTEFEKKPCR